MTKDDDQWKLELIQTMLRHEKTIWDGIEFFCALIPEDQISYRQSGEILSCIVEKGKGSLANALKKVLEIEQDERSDVE